MAADSAMVVLSYLSVHCLRVACTGMNHGAKVVKFSKNRLWNKETML